MKFDWHDSKRASNIEKHRVDFTDVFGCFLDAERLVWEDTRQDYGEIRFNMLGLNGDWIYHVTFTPRGGLT